MRRGHRTAALCLLPLLGCAPEAPPETTAPGTEEPVAALLVDVTSGSGLDFEHRHCGTGEKYFPETMGSGVAMLDYDGDGWTDLYFVNSAPTPEYDGPVPSNRLYRNTGGLAFVDVTSSAGANDPGYGMGATAGDVDNDGDVDLYVTNFGPNTLLRNNGDGTFTSLGESSPGREDEWSTGATFADLDGDGWLDLYVANYVDFSYANHKFCGDRRFVERAYCHPDMYDGVADRLYWNRGDGTLVEDPDFRQRLSEREWTLSAKGLGVVAFDYDRDGDRDLFVANDSTPNFLWRNLGARELVEAALEAGVAFNEDGGTEACMGVDAGDVDRDGWPELMVTNLNAETNTLYGNLGEGYFAGRSFQLGIARPSLPHVGFGTDFADLDADGWLDLIVLNGHIIDNVELVREDTTYAQPNMLFANRHGTGFEEVTARWSPELVQADVARGLATGDLDGDGDLDLVATRNNGAARLLANESDDASYLQLAWRGSLSNRDGLGTEVELHVEGETQVAEAFWTASYLSQHQGLTHFGLGDRARVDEIVVTWPSGLRQRLGRLAAGFVYVMPEPRR